MYQATINCAIGVPVVDWILLFPAIKNNKSEPDEWWTDVSQHGIQGIAAVIEIHLNAMQMNWKYLAHFIGVILLYVFESYVRHAM